MTQTPNTTPAPSLFSLLERLRRLDAPLTPAEWAEAIDGHLPPHEADVAVLVIAAALDDTAPDFDAIGRELGIHANTVRYRLKCASAALPGILHRVLDARATRAPLT